MGNEPIGAAQQVVYIIRYLPKTGGGCITQLAKMSIDPNFVELTDDVVGNFYKILLHGYLRHLRLITRLERGGGVGGDQEKNVGLPGVVELVLGRGC